jgi:hypothetical protein
MHFLCVQTIFKPPDRWAAEMTGLPADKGTEFLWIHKHAENITSREKEARLLPWRDDNESRNGRSTLNDIHQAASRRAYRPLASSRE